MKPLVAVCTAVGPRSGHQRYLEETYESLLESGEQSWEWCVQVDAEPDQRTTRDLRALEKWAEEDHRIHPGYNSGHYGMSVTRNLALLRARAPLAQSLDADDSLLPDSLEKLSEPLLRDKDIAFSFGYPLVLDQTVREEERREDPADLRPGRLEAGEIPEAWMENKVLPLHPEGVMWRRSHALRFGGHAALPTGGDECLALALSNHYPAFYLDEPTFVRRLHLESTSRWTGEASQIDGTKAMLALFRLGEISSGQ